MAGNLFLRIRRAANAPDACEARGVLTVRLLPVSFLLFFTARAFAGEPIVITGPEQRELDLKLPTGALARAPGVANIQVHRASKGWTYNHHVDMAAWKGRLYVAWDSC